MPHRQHFTVFAIAAILVAGILVRGYRSDGSELTNAELKAVRGSEEELGCLQYFTDFEQREFACESPHTGYDDTCSWRKCGPGNGAATCGNGKIYSGQLNFVQYPTNEHNLVDAWQAVANSCTWDIDCIEGHYDEEMSCAPGRIPHPETGCYIPELAAFATGCTECSPGPYTPPANAMSMVEFVRVECNIDD